MHKRQLSQKVITYTKVVIFYFLHTKSFAAFMQFCSFHNLNVKIKKVLCSAVTSWQTRGLMSAILKCEQQESQNFGDFQPEAHQMTEIVFLEQ